MDIFEAIDGLMAVYAVGIFSIGFVLGLVTAKHNK